MSVQGGAGDRLPTVLIVDDEPANLAVLSSVLQPHYRVRAANGGAAALRVAGSDPAPDLILLDVMMPDLDGHAVLERLRRDPRSRDVPVIFVTALGGEEDEERGLKLGAVDFITKPIRPSVVLARVQTHLALKEARDRLQGQNAWLEAEVERRTRENLMIQDITLSILAGLVETRDANTGNHTMRSQAYVEALGRRLQRQARFADALSPSELTRMVKASTLHDIGKVGIPDAILLKPGPLTGPEFDVMKTHARLGADAIAHALERAGVPGGEAGRGREPVLFLETARQMARWHHERWNGKGYPDGLAGDAIPLCARLMGLADVFDALTTRRPYKEPMTAAAAAGLIVEGRGSQFDPSVVDAFLEVQEEFAAIALRFADAP
jgi:putative two-component system response regulator